MFAETSRRMAEMLRNVPLSVHAELDRRERALEQRRGLRPDLVLVDDVDPTGIIEQARARRGSGPPPPHLDPRRRGRRS